ncbi:MAG: glycosyltransferase [Ferruginibacter sp.]
MQRSLKFVKYLPEFNINPIVITVEENDYPEILGSYHLDPALKNEIPAGIAIERVHCRAVTKSKSKLLSWFRIYFSVTENFKKTWRKPLEQRLPEIIRKYQPAAIYVTIPPFAMVPLWLKLLRQSKIPLIIDFRDAWSQWALAPNGSYFHYQVKLSQEAAVLQKATVAVTTTKQTRNDLLRIHKTVSSEKVVVIPNGYDGELAIKPALSVSDKKTIRIGYVGSFYYSPEARNDIFKPWWKKMPHRMLNYVPRKEDWLYRSPYFFLKAIRYMLDHLSIGGSIKLKFILLVILLPG